MSRAALIQRAAPWLAATWGLLGVFLVWDAHQSNTTLGYLLGAVAMLAGLGNLVMAQRGARP